MLKTKLRTTALWLLLILSLFVSGNSYAQGIAINPQTGNLTVQDAGTCAVSSGSSANSFVIQQLPQNAGTSTVTLAGTFSATVTVRLSANGGTTWVTQSAQSAVGTASYNVAGFNYICADITSSSPTGTINVTINSSLASSSGNGVGSGAGPVVAYYICPTSVCPAGNTGNVFQTPANTQTNTTGTWSNSSTTLTCTTCNFTPGDVGKMVMGWSTCATDQPIAQYSNAIASGTTVYTISAYISATQVTLSGTPNGTQSTTPSCLIYGNPDDTAFAALNTALVNQTGYCPKVMLSAAQYLVTKPFLPSSQPAGCSALPSLFGSPTYGNLDLPAGIEWEGRGSGETVINIGNNFPNGGSKTTYNSIASWFAIPPLGGLRDLQISGGGQAGTCAGTTGGDNLIYIAVGKMQDVTLTNFCSIPGNATGSFYLTRGIYSDLLGQFNKLNMSAFGAIGLGIFGAGATSNGVQVAIENSGTMSLDVEGSGDTRWTFSCLNCYLTGSMTFNASQQGNNWGVLNVGGGAAVRLVNSYLFNCPAVNCNTQTGFPILINSAGAGTKIYLDGVAEGVVNNGTNTNVAGGPFCSSVGGHSCSVYIRNSSLTHGSASNSLALGNNADLLVDEGGNSLDIGAWAFAATNTPTIVMDGHSLTGVCTGTASASSTLGFYNSEMNPSNVTTTCTATTVGVGYAVAQPRTLQGLICQSSATTVSVACTVMVNGSTSIVTCTMTAAKSCQDFTHSVALNQGDRISVEMVTGAAETGANIKAQVMWQ